MTCFTGLNIEILCEIFHYLSFSEIYNAFFGLQKSIDNVICKYPSYINLSKFINKNDLQQLSFQCRSLIVSGRDLDTFQLDSSHFNLTSLRSITFRQMNLLQLYSFIEILPLKQLESIRIKRFIWQYYPIDFYRQLWSMIINGIDGNTLRYLYLPYHVRYWSMDKFLDDLPALKHATLEYISVPQMFKFLTNTPNIRQFKACLDSPHRDLFRYQIVLDKLNYLSLYLLDEWSLEELQQLFSICPYLKHLILKLEAYKETKVIFEPNIWQTLIEEKLADLISLRLRLNCVIRYPDIESCNFQDKFNRSEYWPRRRPQFQVLVNEIQRKVL